MDSPERELISYVYAGISVVDQPAILQRTAVGFDLPSLDGARSQDSRAYAKAIARQNSLLFATV
jgi:hypothetical protein